MWAEHAIFTSLARGGRSGYHVVSRSTGVSDADAEALAAWAPSHGALILDDSNRTSVNIHPMPGGRLALTRTCEGPPEYSGRGGRQLYSHALILEEEHLLASDRQPFAIYRDALALGHLNYRPDPKSVLAPVALTRSHRDRDAASFEEKVAALGLGSLPTRADLLATEGDLLLHHQGDRILLAECLLGLLPREAILSWSVSTSLRPSSARPYRLALVP